MNPQDDRNELAQRLILRAAHRAPAALCERLEEEWLADLQSRTTLASRLRLALGCCWATGVITRDFRVPQLATSGAPAGHKSMLGELRYDLPQLSRRTVTFLVIAGIHVVLIYGFITGMAQHVFASIAPVTHAVFLPQDIVQPAPPPPTPIKLRQVNIADLYPEPPQFEIAPPVDPAEQPHVIPDGGSDEGSTDVGRTPMHPPVRRIVGGPGKGFPNTDDYYPSASRRLSETGAATVQVCVDGQGRLTGEPTLSQASGSRRIDDGALSLAKAGSGHYRPTLEDGQPVNSCFPYRIRFMLGN